MASDKQLPSIGVLGGGQLGRMMIQSAINYNLEVHVMDPDPNAPCKDIATSFRQGKLTDFDQVVEFGKVYDLVTIEIENVNTAALKALQKEGVKVFPQPEIIELIQDKRVQKQFYKDHDIPTAPFILTESAEEVRSNSNLLPAVNKLGKEGYDGRGVSVLKSEKDLDKAFDAPGLLEQFVDFEKELAVIVARNSAGEIKSFPVVELSFHPVHNLVEYLFSPASISQGIENKAQRVAKDVIEKLELVGLLAVEMFLTKDGEILVNEVAPRTHNSGHQTIEGNITSQFEQHIRAILNWPLGDTDIKIPSAMVNLLGADGHTGEARYDGLHDVLEIDGTHIHLYGKRLTKPFRKMGHITIVDKELDQLQKKAKLVKSKLKVIA